jgi:predicted amidohydrolase
VLAISVANSSAAAEVASRNLISNPDFQAGTDGRPASGWTTWAPRPELALESKVVTIGGDAALSLQARHFAEYGKWVCLVHGVEPGKFYRVDALSQAHDVASETTSVIALVSWYRNADGTGEIQRDYIDRHAVTGDWRRSFRTFQAPAGAQALKVELGLRWTEHGSVIWKQPRLVEVAPPAARVIRVATTHIVPESVPASIAANTKLMADMLDRIAPAKPDVVLFSEGLVDRATRLPLVEKAQPIPGPLTDMLAERARRYHTYIITSLHERDGSLFYNTAVLIDRDGRIAGKYRKVHLATEEADAGLTPGSEYPVFETDFGRIGLLICWDNWFSEPARILRLRGAEMLFLPLAGDGSDAHWDAVSRARAVDDGLFFISSGTVSDSSRIIDPDGKVLGEARGNFAFVVKDIDLNQEWRLRYLGEGKSLYIQERRPETYSDLVGSTPRPGVPPIRRSRP